MPPLQCLERCHHYRSNKNKIIARLLKFVCFIYHKKILSGNIFVHILKNKMAATGVSLSVMKQCVEIFPLSPLDTRYYRQGSQIFSIC